VTVRTCARPVRLPLAFTALLLGAASLAAQQAPPRITAADYARAEKFLGSNLFGDVVGGRVDAHWLPDERFWYRSERADGAEFVLVDPAHKRRTPLFDHERLAAALSHVAGQTYAATDLPFTDLALSPDLKTVSFNVARQGYSCAGSGASCAKLAAPVPGLTERPRGPMVGGFYLLRGRGGPTSSDGKPLTTSPDGKLGAFVRDWNLWVHDMATGQERQLTTDGMPDDGYATDNAGWSSSDRAVVLWSPDSKLLATQQQDERHVGFMYLVSTPVDPVGHPTLRAHRFPLPGDSVVAMIDRVVVDVATGKVTRLQMPPDFHRGTLGDDISMTDYKWSPDATRLAIASVSRYHKHVWVSVADIATGAVRKAYQEDAATQYESFTGWYVLWDTNELVWFSQRSNWGQLYLYDLTTGQMRNQITTGDDAVTRIERIDPKTRTLWYGANGKEPGQDPYFLHYYRVNLDGTHDVSLTPDGGTHSIDLSPSGRWLVDTYSQPDVPPVVAVRDNSGRLVMPLEQADISKLLAAGWKPPIPITVKAHDGTTDLYGLMFVPTNLDTTKQYPIINNVYPGPQTGSVGRREFSPARGDRQALAELGFVVVTIDGMGTPDRSKAFQDEYYGAMGRDNTIPDQIEGMKQLAERYHYIDIDRTGIYGHSGGGFATTTAMFRYPDFFKVGIAESGNHDQRENEDDWGERYQGPLVYNPDGTSNYTQEANQNFAQNLKGHLLLAHGTMDTNVPPYETLLVVDALIKANKDFDLLFIPNANHGYGAASNYMMRRRWDYFVRWLLNTEPPREFEIEAGGRR
jgi:dipeptidyl aminopeptidase/acylaminoacyl peptidase